MSLSQSSRDIRAAARASALAVDGESGGSRPVSRKGTKKKAGSRGQSKKDPGEGHDEDSVLGVSVQVAGANGASAGTVVGTTVTGTTTVDLIAENAKLRDDLARMMVIVQGLANANAASSLGPSGVSTGSVPVRPSTVSAASSSPSIRSATPNGPLNEHYSGEGGLKLDAWIRATSRLLAFYSGITDSTAVAWLATGLTGAAGDWFDEFVTANSQPPGTPTALYDGLRRRFQPVNSAETARRDLDVLRQTKSMSVNDYTTRFRQLITHLPSDSVETRMFQYRRGLLSVIEDKISQAEPQPVTLDAVISLAARIEGRSSASSGRIDQVAGAESDPSSMGNSAFEQLNALIEKAVARTAEAVHRQYDSRRNRGANKSSFEQPLWRQVGLTKEEGNRRRMKNLCMYCAQSSHTHRDCPSRLGGKPANLAGSN